MVEKRDCSFCGNPIEPGTGLMYVKRDGTRYMFCKAKCRRNTLTLKRVPRTVKWTKHYVKGQGKVMAAGKATVKVKAAPAKAEPEAPPEAPPAEAKPPEPEA